MFLIISIILGNTLIPSNYYNRDSILFNRIKPNTEIECWEYRRYYLDGNSSFKYQSVYSSCKADLQYTISSLPSGSYLSNIYFNNFADIILYKTRHGLYNIVRNKDDLYFFLDTIDTIEDGLFLLSYFGYWFIPGSNECGSYVKKDDGIIFNINKIEPFTDVINIDEELKCCKLFIDYKGKITTF